MNPAGRAGNPSQNWVWHYGQSEESSAPELDSSMKEDELSSSQEAASALEQSGNGEPSSSQAAAQFEEMSEDELSSSQPLAFLDEMSDGDEPSSSQVSFSSSEESSNDDESSSSQESDSATDDKEFVEFKTDPRTWPAFFLKPADPRGYWRSTQDPLNSTKDDGKT